MRVSLNGGAYQSGSLIASSQRCVNLYAENIPQAEGEPSRTTHYQTPGLRPLHVLSNGAPVRGLYTASNGDLYAVAGSSVYYLTPTYRETVVGTLTTVAGPVSMTDNTLTLVIVDGSVRGANPTTYDGGMQVDLSTRVASPMPTATAGFYGSDLVWYLGTFLVFNKPKTPQFYVSGSLAVTFDPLDFANKSSAADYLVAAIPARGQLLLIGKETSEVWTLSGASDFAFQQLQGAVIEHGCMAVHSVAKSDGAVFFLSIDRQGRSIVLKAAGYSATRISTHAIENAIAGYADASASRGYCRQERGHIFYVLTFPEATWVFDEATNLWHQWVSFGADGAEHRHRGDCFTYAYDTAIVGDYQTGALYALDTATFTDNGLPIRRIRSFPHMIDDAERLSYKRFVADIEVATGPDAEPASLMQLRYSDDRGATYGHPVFQTMGLLGQTYTSVQFRRLGLARDRVFEVSWTSASKVSLNGAFIDVEKSIS